MLRFYLFIYFYRNKLTFVFDTSNCCVVFVIIYVVILLQSCGSLKTVADVVVAAVVGWKFTNEQFTKATCERKIEIGL